MRWENWCFLHLRLPEIIAPMEAGRNSVTTSSPPFFWRTASLIHELTLSTAEAAAEQSKPDLRSAHSLDLRQEKIQEERPRLKHLLRSWHRRVSDLYCHTCMLGFFLHGFINLTYFQGSYVLQHSHVYQCWFLTMIPLHQYTTSPVNRLLSVYDLG